MQQILLLIILLTLSSCREEESRWNELSADEQAYLRSRARVKCEEDNANAYKNYKKLSGESFASSTYNRAKGVEIKFKQGDVVTITTDMKVWKKDTINDVLYFYVTRTNSDYSTDSYFLRLPVSQNDDIINDFLSDQCEEIYTASLGSSGPLSVKYPYTVPISSGKYEYTDNYSFKFDEPAFLGSYRLSRKVVTYNSDGKQTNSATFATTLTHKTYPNFSTTDFTNSAYVQKFCSVDFETGSRYRLSKTDVGLKKSCQNTFPAGWDLSL